MKFLVLKGNVQYTSCGPLTCIRKMYVRMYVIVDYLIYHVMANCWCMEKIVGIQYTLFE